MSKWHGETTSAALHDGAEVVVASDHSVVRIQTADQMTIETASRLRLMAVVIERTGDKLFAGLPDGTTFRMQMASDDSLGETDLSKVFSHQSWTVTSANMPEGPPHGIH